MKKKKYAIGMLAYPGKNANKWNYLFGACMIAHRFKQNAWFVDNCDIIVLTPEINDANVKNIIKLYFDINAIYTTPLNMDFPFKTNPRWYGVFNKLYFWNSHYFNYDRLLILDTDLFIMDTSGYIDAFINISGQVAGCYENGFIINNTDFNFNNINATIPSKYTSYYWNGKSYYNMVNAGVLSIIPNNKLFNIMMKDVDAGWGSLANKYPALVNKKGDFLFPEQEYLTGLFSGQWKCLPRKFLSCATTELHYNDHGSKYWDKFPSLHGKYSEVVTESKQVLQHPLMPTIFQNIIDNITQSLKIIGNTKSKFSSIDNMQQKRVNKIKHFVDVEVPINNTTDPAIIDHDINQKIKEQKPDIGITQFNHQNNKLLKKLNKPKPKEYLSPNVFPIKKNEATDNLSNYENILHSINSLSNEIMYDISNKKIS